MKDILDVHTHTYVSGHAYSTVSENIRAAKDKGLELVGISEHSIMLPGSCHEYYFMNMRVIPREYDGIRLVVGAELNILDYSGSTDMTATALKQLDYAIASFHRDCIEAGTVAENTAAVIGVMRNPHVCIIGHPDNPQYPIDFDRVAQAAADNHVLLELNNSSYRAGGYRTGSRENAKIMLATCKKYNTSVIMGSDAHIAFDVGNHELSQAVVDENNFPAELVVNTDTKKFFDVLEYRKSLRP